MPRSYRHIQEYENFIIRYNRRQDKITAGVAIKRKVFAYLPSQGKVFY